MTITLHIAATLRAYCHEARSELNFSADTVGAALGYLEQHHEALYRGICDETGAVRRHVHVFVNDALIHDRAGFNTALIDGDVLSIMPAVSGG